MHSKKRFKEVLKKVILTVFFIVSFIVSFSIASCSAGLAECSKLYRNEPKDAIKLVKTLNAEDEIITLDDGTTVRYDEVSRDTQPFSLLVTFGDKVYYSTSSKKLYFGVNTELSELYFRTLFIDSKYLWIIVLFVIYSWLEFVIEPPTKEEVKNRVSLVIFSSFVMILPFIFYLLSIKLPKLY